MKNSDQMSLFGNYSRSKDKQPETEGSLKVNQDRCNFLERKTDDLEQYGRRLYIRIDGVEVNEDETEEEMH